MPGKYGYDFQMVGLRIRYVIAVLGIKKGGKWGGKKISSSGLTNENRRAG